MRQIRLAVVGCGGIAMGQHLPNVTRSEKVQLYACCDINPAALERAGKNFNPVKAYKHLDDVLSDDAVEGIILATFHQQRYEQIRRCMEAGKPVLVEKPMATNIDEAKRIVEVVRKHNGLLAVNYNRRCAPASVLAKEAVAHHRKNPCSPAWRFIREPDNPLLKKREEMFLYRINDDRGCFKSAFIDVDTGGGLIRSEVCHFMDYVHWFLEQRPTEVMAIGGHEGTVSITVRFDRGATAVIVTSAEGSAGYPKELLEYFGMGAAVVNHFFVEVDIAGIPTYEGRHVFPLPKTPFYVERPDAEVPPIDPKEFSEGGLQGYLAQSRKTQQWAESRGHQLEGVLFPDKGHVAAVEIFAEACANGTAPAADETAGYRAALMVERVIEAMESGRPKTFTEDEWNF